VRKHQFLIQRLIKNNGQSSEFLTGIDTCKMFFKENANFSKWQTTQNHLKYSILHTHKSYQVGFGDMSA